MTKYFKISVGCSHWCTSFQTTIYRRNRINTRLNANTPTVFCIMGESGFYQSTEEPCAPTSLPNVHKQGFICITVHRTEKKANLRKSLGNRHRATPTFPSAPSPQPWAVQMLPKQCTLIPYESRLSRLLLAMGLFLVTRGSWGGGGRVGFSRPH